MTSNSKSIDLDHSMESQGEQHKVIVLKFTASRWTLHGEREREREREKGEET